MSFYSYKNGNPESAPGLISGSDTTRGMNEKVCVQVKRVYDSCMQQEQLDDVIVCITNIVPVISPIGCGNVAGCGCRPNPLMVTPNVIEVEGIPGPVPVPPFIFDSCRSSTINGNIRNLAIERMCDRPHFARVRGIVEIPIDILFTDSRNQEFMGRAVVCVPKDVLLAIPDESIVPFTLDTLVSAICVTGVYLGNDRFRITICVTIILKILAEVELLIPSYGFCPIPPCEEFAENVCDEFFSLPLFPQQCTMTASDTPSMTPLYTQCPTNGTVAGFSAGYGGCTTCR